MSRQSRAFGASLALHAAALLVVFGLGGAAEKAREPRIIDLSFLQPSGAEIASHPGPSAPSVKHQLQARAARHRAASTTLPSPTAPATAALPPPVQSLEEPTKVPTAPVVTPPAQESMAEAAVPVLAANVGSLPPATPGGEITQGSATGFPSADPSTHTPAESARHTGGAGRDLAAAAPFLAPSGGFGAGADAGVPRDVAALRALIKQHLVYPGVARRLGWEGKVLLSFIICGNGRARDVTILESSGRELLDRHALETVSRISSFPASATDAQVIVPVVYRLN